MRHNVKTRSPRIQRRLRPALTTLATSATLLTAAVACGDLLSLEQENPGQLSAETLYVPGNAQLIVNGVIADFECAFNRYVVGSGLLSDELLTAIASVDNYNYEGRRLTTGASYGTASCGGVNQQPPIYTPLSTARGVADTALAKLESWTDAEVPNRVKLVGQAAAYAGYTLVLMGEGMCSAAINLGPELTPTQLFEEAEARFDKAIQNATAAGDAATLNLALLGRARTLQNLGDLAGAEADALLIPSSFVANMSTDGVNTRRQNYLYAHTRQNAFSSVDPAFRGVLLEGNPDPRVLVTNTLRNGTAPGVQIWTADKYGSLTAPIAIAKYAEAQLIVAEARAEANDLAGAADAINAARNTHPGMPQYDETGQTQAQVLAQIVEERRRELFLEGHRLGDIRRYNLPLNPAINAPYTTGGGTYGDQRCFPLPDVERINNPNIG